MESEYLGRVILAFGIVGLILYGLSGCPAPPTVQLMQCDAFEDRDAYVLCMMAQEMRGNISPEAAASVLESRAVVLEREHDERQPEHAE